MTSCRCRSTGTAEVRPFLDIYHRLGPLQPLFETLVSALQSCAIGCQGVGRRGLWATFGRYQCTIAAACPMAPPLDKRRGVHALAAKDRADRTRGPCSSVELVQNPKLVAGRESASARPVHQFRGTLTLALTPSSASGLPRCQRQRQRQHRRLQWSRCLRSWAFPCRLVIYALLSKLPAGPCLIVVGTEGLPQIF